MAKGTRELPPSQSSGWGKVGYFGNGHLAPGSRVGFTEHNSLTLARIPPIASQKPVESWNIPPFLVRACGYAVYPPANVLAVAEHKWE